MSSTSSITALVAAQNTLTEVSGVSHPTSAIKRRDFLRRSFLGTAFAASGIGFTNVSLGATDGLRTGHSFKPVSSNHYERMFPHLAGDQSESDPELEGWLAKLGQNMRDDPKSRPSQKFPPPMAGYTYLGQFINHDLTFDLTPLDQVQPDASRMLNLRTPFLDLDHLYGGGPNVSPFLYDHQSKPTEEKFLIGNTIASTVNGKDFPSTPDDLPRNSQGTALVPDPRQDENLIIAQLHVAFLKLHNRVIDALKRGELASDGTSLFQQANRIVRWHYQWVVRYDYLRALLDPDVFEGLRFTQPNWLQYGEPFQIPIEYNIAAARFGHSMVRDEYFINDIHSEASLKDDVARLTGMRGGLNPQLPADWVISWERFFFVGSAEFVVRSSRAIDTRIANGLFEAEHPGAPPLPVKTLIRGQRAGVPSGQDVARACGLDPLEPEQIAAGGDNEILVSSGCDRKTPLWYYLLKEAELTARGAHLGVLGSKLVGEVILAALANDPGSYQSMNPSWVPTLPGPRNPELFGMADLLRFVSKPNN